MISPLPKITEIFPDLEMSADKDGAASSVRGWICSAAVNGALLSHKQSLL